ncbi:MAG TPA: acetate--CoA ligase family protein [Candidatus Binatia bacterium]|nr:acetate--CoA ligase family protein [Candidatus Binatia bacterium]
MLLSEFESKEVLRAYGIATVEERLARDPDEAVRRANELGYPVAVKLCASGLAHKTERNLVRLGLARNDEVRAASADVLGRREAHESQAQLLVQRMIGGRRELILGLTRDRQFGPCVMLGLGGILAEALRDVAFRVAPLAPVDALEMVEELKAAPLLGEFRGEPEIDREALARALVALGTIGLEHPEINSIDVNPMIVAGRRLIAVDALIERSTPR